jgi:hypothetical protein
MSIMRQDAGQGFATGLANGLANGLRLQGVGAGRGPTTDVGLLSCDVIWHVRSGSLREGLLGTAASNLRGMHADHEALLVWMVRGDTASCELRGGCGAVCVIDEVFEADIDECPQTGLLHVRVMSDKSPLLIATLRNEGDGWHAMYAQTTLLATSSVSGGRYEVERE